MTSKILWLLFTVMVHGYRVVTTRTNPPFQIALHDHKDLVCESIAHNGLWEGHHLEEIRKLGKGNFLDIGAHIGMHALYAAALGFNVYAFEPLQTNVDLLRVSVALNPGFVNRVKIYPYGLAETNRHCHIVSENVNWGDGMLACDDRYKEVGLKGGWTYHIRDNITLRTLDSLQNELPNFDIIKLDVEGSEPRIFEGGKEFFEKQRSGILLMEVADLLIRGQGYEPVAFLQSLPYNRAIEFTRNGYMINLTNTVEVTNYVRNCWIDLKFVNVS